MAGQPLRGDWVRVMTANVDVTVTSPTTADFRGIYLFGRSRAKTLKDLAKESTVSAYEITAAVELEPDEWRFVSASWQQADPPSLL